jgi:hypothetical protein
VFGANQDNSLEMGLVFVNKRNVLKTTWDPGTSGEYARWISRYGSVTINFVGYQMAWAGMNEAGLMLSTMSLVETQEPAPDERPPHDALCGGYASVGPGEFPLSGGERHASRPGALSSPASANGRLGRADHPAPGGAILDSPGDAVAGFRCLAHDGGAPIDSGQGAGHPHRHAVDRRID